MGVLDQERIDAAMSASQHLWIEVYELSEHGLPSDQSIDLQPFFYCRHNAYSIIEKESSRDSLLAWTALAFFWSPNDTLPSFLISLAKQEKDLESLGLALRTSEHLGFGIICQQQEGDTARQEALVTAMPLSEEQLIIEVPSNGIVPKQDFRKEQLDLVKKYVGIVKYNQLVSSRDHCLKGLVDPDPKMRWASINILAELWIADVPDKIMLEILEGDEKELVKVASISFLAKRYYSSDNKCIGAAVAKAITNNITSDVVRNAIGALYKIQGIPLYDFLALGEPVHIDKGFIGSFHQ